jgi:PAS domain S-box-containing protein
MADPIRDHPGHKQTEEALLELVDYNRSLIEASIDPLVTIDCDGKIQDVNTATERATGMPRNELIGTDFSDYFTEPEKAREGYRLVFSRGKVLDFPLEIRHSDGHTIPVCYNATIYHDRDGNLKGVFAAARDITGLRRTEEALRESELRYRALVDNALEAILIFDFTGTALFANNATAALVEVDDPHTLTGRNVLEFIAPESRDAVLADFISVMAGSDTYLTQYKVITINGQEIWVESIGKKIEFGGAPADIVMLRDITERKRTEEALKESECRMKDIISFLPDATLVIDKNGTVLAWNRAMEVMTGVPAEQMIGKGNYEYALPFYHERRPITVDLVLHDDPAIVAKYPVMKKEGNSLYSEIFIPHLNKGEGAHLWFMASPLYDASGNLTGAIESIRDITERKRADDALRLASRKLNLLSSITRHDINNQLTVLMGYTTLLEKKQPDPSFHDYFQKINTSAERISAMIQFTKEYEQIGITTPTWQDCRTLVEKAAKEAPLGNVIVKNDLPAGAELFADPLIIKVFYNLMDNAARHGGKITTIGFTVGERDSDHILVCEDDGEGVPAEVKEKIFERGFGRNTGLGLYLAREILSITGITITENGEQGKGARFELVVPRGIYRIK